MPMNSCSEHSYFPEYHRKLAPEAVLDVVPQYHCRSCAAAADSRLIPSARAIVDAFTNALYCWHEYKDTRPHPWHTSLEAGVHFPPAYSMLMEDVSDRIIVWEAYHGWSCWHRTSLISNRRKAVSGF